MATADEPRVAVITGASSGIGRATALEFAGKGYNLVLAARRKQELDEVAAECQEHGIHAITVETDMANETNVQQLAKAAVTAFNGIDVWLNNAGVYLVSKFEDAPMEDIRRLMDVNFYGYVFGSRAALNRFREQGYGTLINISSVNAAAPQPYVGIYSASKAAIRAFDESIRMELRLDGLQDAIHVCTVMPASIDTNLFQNSANYTGKDIQALEPVYDARYAARRIAGLAERPRRELIIGSAGRMMEAENTLLPALYERQFAGFTKHDLLGDQTVDENPGNLYAPIDNHTGIGGGWRERRVRGEQVSAGMSAGLLVAGLAGLGMYLIRRSD